MAHCYGPVNPICSLCTRNELNQPSVRKWVYGAKTCGPSKILAKATARPAEFCNMRKDLRVQRQQLWKESLSLSTPAEKSVQRLDGSLAADVPIKQSQDFFLSP